MAVETLPLPLTILVGITLQTELHGTTKYHLWIEVAVSLSDDLAVDAPRFV